MTPTFDPRPPSRKSSKFWSSRGAIAVAAVLGWLSMAPTVGDVGGCGHDATLLDRDVYANARKLQDCDECQECGLATTRCVRACDPNVPPEVVLPTTCRPLLHDGEVCLRALAAASCDDFAKYVADVGPTSPSECEFCKVAPVTPETFTDAGAVANSATTDAGLGTSEQGASP